MLLVDLIVVNQNNTFSVPITILCTHGSAIRSAHNIIFFYVPKCTVSVSDQLKDANVLLMKSSTSLRRFNKFVVSAYRPGEKIRKIL